MSVVFEIKNNIAVLTINNGNKLNVLNSHTMNEIANYLDELEKKARVLIIFGNDKAFAAGVDINEINLLDYESAYNNEFINQKWECILNAKIPVISGVDGYALGGGFEMVLASDIVISTERAIFGFPEVKLGLMPGLGGTQLLTRAIGMKKACELIMTGNFITAKEAYDMRIINKVVDKNILKEEVIKLANDIINKPFLSVKAIKESIKLSQNVGLEQGIKIERHLFRSLFSTKDKNKQVTKFLKK